MSKAAWRVVLFAGIAVSIVSITLYLTYTRTNPVRSLYGRVLIPDQTVFHARDDNRLTVRWLAQRWSVPEEQIYMIVQDQEPWMHIIGMLEIQSLTSAKIWIINRNHQEGQAWEASLIRKGVPHNDDVYLVNEYAPDAISKPVAARFYSTPTSLDGDETEYAVIQDIHWIDAANGLGSIEAYHSQKYLPSITVPVKKGIPQKGQAIQTPVH